MPDISMCANMTCPLKEDCYRFKAVPNPHRQSYAGFKPDEEGKCDHFCKIKKGDRIITIKK